MGERSAYERYTDLIAKADADLVALLRDLATRFPDEAVKVLLETGALEQYAECGRCAGRDVCQWVHSVNPEDIPECVPVYRLVTEENP